MNFTDNDLAIMRLALLSCLVMIDEYVKSEDMSQEQLEVLSMNNTDFAYLDAKIAKIKEVH
ncbi:MAG: hypothetical protein COB23_03120 [Methylophaga sp.]|nr:MAG: hypothetical protein COB23_03120 [Methylophaga sp.]